VKREELDSRLVVDARDRHLARPDQLGAIFREGRGCCNHDDAHLRLSLTVIVTTHTFELGQLWSTILPWLPWF